MSFIREAFSESDGKASSKRLTMAFFCLLFAFELLYNLFTGKTVLQLYAVQLFDVMSLTIVTVLGGKALDVFMVLRGGKVSSTSTTIAPPGSVVATTETAREPATQTTTTITSPETKQ